jgi:hypothetical protein
MTGFAFGLFAFLVETGFARTLFLGEGLVVSVGVRGAGIAVFL